MTRARRDAAAALPHGPRLYSAEQAAAYVGMGRETFIKQVECGVFPRPVALRNCRLRLWDRVALDAALDQRLTVAVDVAGHGEATRDERRQAWQDRRARKGGAAHPRGRDGQGISV